MLYLSIIDSISHMRYDMSDRNWKEYNEALVRRGEILLDMEFLDNWSKELKIMNRGKEGARFRYPESFIRLLAIIHYSITI